MVMDDGTQGHDGTRLLAVHEQNVRSQVGLAVRWETAPGLAEGVGTGLYCQGESGLYGRDRSSHVAVVT